MMMMMMMGPAAAVVVEKLWCLMLLPGLEPHGNQLSALHH